MMPGRHALFSCLALAAISDGRGAPGLDAPPIMVGFFVGVLVTSFLWQALRHLRN